MAAINLKILFVINQFAGNNQNTCWQMNIDNYFSQKSWTINYFLLAKNPDIEILKQYIFNQNPATVVAVGGDGTIMMLANIIAGSNIALGILPGGSANAMALELGIPNTIDNALKIIENGNIKTIDTIRFNNKTTCLHISDIGINALLIKYFNQGNLRGKLGYAKLFFKVLFNHQKMSVSIRSTDLNIQRQALMVAITNATMYGTGLLINPKGILDDGKFEIIIVQRLSLFAIIKMILKVGTFNPNEIEVFPFTNIEINTRRKVHFQIDGEYMGRTKYITAQIVPLSCRLIVP